MTHEKTFNAISKLKDVEMELHRLKNALEMANKALDAQRTWVGLTDEEMYRYCPTWLGQADFKALMLHIESKLKHKNTRGQE